MIKHNENKSWLSLEEDNKSYLVKVLHFFHYRPIRVSKSWRREEVLTWELIQALEILPKEYFLKKVLVMLKEKLNYPQMFDCLLKNLYEIKITEYPKLGLAGNKNKSASDIGVNYKEDYLWLEAKTTEVKEEILKAQIDTQKRALHSLHPKGMCNVVPIIPFSQQFKGEKVYWGEISKLLEEVIGDLLKEKHEIVEGYIQIATELKKRIKGFSELNN